MIVEEARQLIELTELKVQLRVNVDLRQGFRSRQEELAEGVSELEEREEAIRGLCARGSAAPDVGVKASNFLNQITSVLSKFEADPSWIIDFNIAPFNNALRGLTKECDSHIFKAWQVYGEKARHANTEVLNVLGSIPAFSSTVKKIQALARQIDSLRSRNPRGEVDLQAFDNLVVEMDKTWNELGSEDVPPAIMKFLRASGSREGAMLELLTDEVKEWLQSRKIEESFRVHLRP